MQTLIVKRLHLNAKFPTYAFPGDSGLDLYAVESVDIPPQRWKTVLTGIAIQLPPGCEGQIRPRSGLAQENGVTVLNSPCTIDNGYRGELRIVLINHGPATFVVQVGMRVAQLVVQPVINVTVVPSTELGDSPRSAGGFGSSGLMSL